MAATIGPFDVLRRCKASPHGGGWARSVHRQLQEVEKDAAVWADAVATLVCDMCSRPNCWVLPAMDTEPDRGDVLVTPSEESKEVQPTRLLPDLPDEPEAVPPVGDPPPDEPR